MSVRVLRVVESPAVRLPLSASAPHPLAIVATLVIQHINGDGTQGRGYCEHWRCRIRKPTPVARKRK